MCQEATNNLWMSMLVIDRDYDMLFNNPEGQLCLRERLQLD